MANGEHRTDFQWTNVRNQYLAAFTSSLLTLGYGCMLGWISPSLPKLASESTPLSSGPLTNTQISWVGSISAIGVIFGSLAFGFLTSHIGCKRATALVCIPSAAFWILIYFGYNYYHILLAEFLCGVAFGGMQTTSVLFISEIADDAIRGRLDMIRCAVGDVGILIGYTFGTYLDYKLVPLISGLVPVSFALVFVTLPNSAQYYLSKKQYQNAEYAFKFYKGYIGRSQYEQSAFLIEFEKLKLIASKHEEENKIQFADFCTIKSVKGIGIGIALVVFAQFTANAAIIVYSVTIFEKTGGSFDPYLSAIILAVILILGSFVGAFFADLLGRRILIFFSLAGSAIGLFTISSYQYLKLNGFELLSFEFIPLLSISFVIFMSNFVMKLATICCVENLPQKIRTCGMVIISLFMSMSVFVCLKSVPTLIEKLDLYGCMTIFGIGCTVGAIFVLCILGETSGLPLHNISSNDEIDNYDNSRDMDRQPLIPMQNRRTDYLTFNNHHGERQFPHVAHMRIA